MDVSVMMDREFSSSSSCIIDAVNSVLANLLTLLFIIVQWTIHQASDQQKLLCSLLFPYTTLFRSIRLRLPLPPEIMLMETRSAVRHQRHNMLQQRQQSARVGVLIGRRTC